MTFQNNKKQSSNTYLRSSAFSFSSIIFVFALIIAVFSLPLLAQEMSNNDSKSMNSEIATVLQSSSSPIVSFRIQFLTGSIYDPKGKEGLASLTAAMIAQAGSKKLTYDEIQQEFYPLATGFGWQVDKEMTTFIGSTHSENLDKYYGIISQMILEPGFRADDFKRLKENAINFLKVSLREGNDEELGKERLYNIIYAGHPYQHHSMGTISGLESITLVDVENFYERYYTQNNLVVGLSGGFDDSFSRKMLNDFAKLPVRPRETVFLSEPKLEAGMKIDIVKRETRATAISLGFPIDVNRASEDYAALAVVASYFGQHRSSNSYLYGKLREDRGLNYGDYAYIEYFPRGMFQFQPDPNLAREQQIFQIWIRPVEPQNANFTLRATLYEYDKLINKGMTQKSFQETRDFLIKYVNILTQTKDAELGYALDSRFYQIGNFNEYMKKALAKLTLKNVNKAIKKHLKTENMRVVMVTKDAEGLRDEIVNNTPGLIKYPVEKPKEIISEDKLISTYKIPVKAENISITPIGDVFK